MIIGAFGTTIDIKTGQLRSWYMSNDGVKRWHDNNKPCSQCCGVHVNDDVFAYFYQNHGIALSQSEIEDIKSMLKYKDSLRYDFIRNADIDSVENGGLFAGKTPDNIVINGIDLDEEIDRLMAND